MDQWYIIFGKGIYVSQWTARHDQSEELMSRFDGIMLDGSKAIEEE